MGYFDGIFGNDRVKMVLSKLLSSGDVWRTFVFSGMDGVGKFLFAERLSLVALCEGEKRPCGRCTTCLSYMEGVSPYIKILEPEGNSITISQVRRVLEFLSTGSERGRFVIIRGGHLLTHGAASALLKTMEEVPEKTCFIILTPALSSLIPTLRSRAFVIHFKPLTLDELGSFMKSRGCSPSSEELVFLYRMSGGSPGMALELFEKDFFSRVERLYYGIKSGDVEVVRDIVKGPKDEIKKLLEGLLSYMTMKGEGFGGEASRIVHSLEFIEKDVRADRVALFLSRGG